MAGRRKSSILVPCPSFSASLFPLLPRGSAYLYLMASHDLLVWVPTGTYVFHKSDSEKETISLASFSLWDPFPGTGSCLGVIDVFGAGIVEDLPGGNWAAFSWIPPALPALLLCFKSIPSCVLSFYLFVNSFWETSLLLSYSTCIELLFWQSYFIVLYNHFIFIVPCVMVALSWNFELYCSYFFLKLIFCFLN